jgi:hypothetical protein
VNGGILFSPEGSGGGVSRKRTQRAAFRRGRDGGDNKGVFERMVVSGVGVRKVMRVDSKRMCQRLD